jgi:hypothetical protein
MSPQSVDWINECAKFIDASSRVEQRMSETMTWQGELHFNALSHTLKRDGCDERA